MQDCIAMSESRKHLQVDREQLHPGSLQMPNFRVWVAPHQTTRCVKLLRHRFGLIVTRATVLTCAGTLVVVRGQRAPALYVMRQEKNTVLYGLRQENNTPAAG